MSRLATNLAIALLVVGAPSALTLGDASAQSVISIWSLNGAVDSGVPRVPIFSNPSISVSPLNTVGLTTGVFTNAYMVDGWPTGALDPAEGMGWCAAVRTSA